MKFVFKSQALMRDLQARLAALMPDAQLLLTSDANGFPKLVMGDRSIVIKVDDQQKVGAQLKDAIGLEAHAYNPHVAEFDNATAPTALEKTDAIIIAELAKMGVKVIVKLEGAVLVEIPAYVFNSNIQQ